MTLPKKIKHYFVKITNSREFLGSETNIRLLRYLVEKSLSGQIPHEIDIAIDFFQRDASYSTSDDSLVRSHVWTLRKKLEKYYLTEGKSDQIQFRIPKGRYQVVFSDPPEKRRSRRSNRLFVTVCFALTLLAFFCVFFWLRQSRINDRLKNLSPIPANDPVWADVLHSEKPVRLVLGDYFIFWEKKKFTQGDRKIRDGAINSQQDLQDYLERYPGEAENVASNTGSYLAPSVLDRIPGLLRLFTLNGKPAEFVPASQLSENDLMQYNLVFAGPFKTLRLLNKYIEQLRLRYQIYPHKIILDDKEASFDYRSMTLPDNIYFQNDYVLFAKIPGPDRNYIYIIGSFSPGGNRLALDMMFENKLVPQVREKFLKPEEKFPEYFESLVHISNIENQYRVTLTQFFTINPENIRH